MAMSASLSWGADPQPSTAAAAAQDVLPLDHGPGPGDPAPLDPVGLVVVSDDQADPEALAVVAEFATDRVEVGAGVVGDLDRDFLGAEGGVGGEAAQLVVEHPGTAQLGAELVIRVQRHVAPLDLGRAHLSRAARPAVRPWSPTPARPAHADQPGRAGRPWSGRPSHRRRRLAGWPWPLPRRGRRTGPARRTPDPLPWSLPVT